MVRIAAAQTRAFRQDLEGALRCLEDLAARARDSGASLLCLPEAFLQGYPVDAQDARQSAIDIGSPAFELVLRRLPVDGPMVVMGLTEAAGARLHNSAVVVDRGSVIGLYRKAHLLKGELFFTAGVEARVFEAGALRLGINICYDTNFPAAARAVAELGATLILCPSNNMMRRAKAEKLRLVHNRIRGERCRETGLWLLSADVTGEREGCVSWGPTALLDPAGRVVAQLPLGQEGLLVVDLPSS